MLSSMTGYGRVAREHDSKSITVELRSLNSKQLDLKLRLPQQHREQENEVRRLLTVALERGKIDLNIDIRYTKGAETNLINHTTFAAYHIELKRLCEENGVQGDMLRAILMYPGIFETTNDDADMVMEWNAIVGCLEEAIIAFNKFRLDEGAVIQADMTMRIRLIEDYLNAVIPFEKERIDKLRARFEQNLTDWTTTNRKIIDENRLEQEIIFYIEKMDITEEKTRLRQHCSYFLEELADTKSPAKGRKLNFISQEIGREINTLGSKANSADIQRLVVMMKDELEKIKEQIANVL